MLLSLEQRTVLGKRGRWKNCLSSLESFLKNNMYIIAFETSCDDTSLAVFKNDELVSMDTMSQIRIHNRTNGVVPEVAAREHANNIFDVLETVLDRADITLQDIDHIAVTTHP